MAPPNALAPVVLLKGAGAPGSSAPAAGLVLVVGVLLIGSWRLAVGVGDW